MTRSTLAPIAAALCGLLLASSVMAQEAVIRKNLPEDIRDKERDERDSSYIPVYPGILRKK